MIIILNQLEYQSGDCMCFSYKDYLLTTVVLPFLVIIIMLLLLAVSSIKFVGKMISRTNSLSDVAGYLFCFTLILIIVFSQVKFLKNGGFGLLKDNCNQTQTVLGIIERIDSPSNRFPGFKLSHNYGADIVIADKCFFIITSNNLTEGDSVAITYLPHSQFVLSIQSTERDSGTVCINLFEK